MKPSQPPPEPGRSSRTRSLGRRNVTDRRRRHHYIVGSALRAIPTYDKNVVYTPMIPSPPVWCPCHRCRTYRVRHGVFIRRLLPYDLENSIFHHGTYRERWYSEEPCVHFFFSRCSDTSRLPLIVISFPAAVGHLDVVERVVHQEYAKEYITQRILISLSDLWLVLNVSIVCPPSPSPA